MKGIALAALALASLTACDAPSAPPSAAPALDAGAAPASSGLLYQYRYVLINTIFNPCAPEEDVAIEGPIHYVVTGEPETPTSMHYKVHVNMQGIEGVGLVSGDRYRVLQNDGEEQEVSFPPLYQAFHYDSRYRVIRQGSSDDLWIRQTGSYSSATGILVETFTMECRG